MTRSKNKVSILLIAIGTLFTVVPTLIVILPFGILPLLAFLLSFVSLAGFVLNLIGIIRLRNTSYEFKRAFVMNIVCIILAFLTPILNLLLGYVTDNLLYNVLYFVILITETANSLLQIYIVFEIIAGCANTIGDYQLTSFGRTTTKIYVSCLLIGVILSIITNFSTSIPWLYYLIATLHLIVITIGNVYYIIFLFKSYKTF